MLPLVARLFYLFLALCFAITARSNGEIYLFPDGRYLISTVDDKLIYTM